MKFIHSEVFQNHFDEPGFPIGIYLIIGKDLFLKSQSVKKITSFFIQKKFDYNVFSGEAFSLDHFLEDLEALNLFSEKKILFLQDVDKLPKNILKILESKLLQLSPSIAWVMTASSISQATTFYKQVDKLGHILELQEEKPAEKEKTLSQWVLKELSAHEKKMDSKALAFFVKQAGLEGFYLEQELKKLICYVGEKKEITLQDVEAICISIPSETIWQLGEALFKRDSKTSLKISLNLLQDNSFFSLIRQIRNQFQTEFQVCSILHSGGTPKNVTDSFPYMKGFILDRHMNLAREYGITRFKKGIKAIDETELLAKNGVSDHEFLMEMLIAKLSI